MYVKKLRSTMVFLETFVWLAVFLIVWEVASKAKLIPSYVAPAPSNILTSFSNFAIVLPQVTVTLYEVLSGYTVAIVVGIGLAILVIHFRVLEAIFNPLIIFSRMIPEEALAPFFVLLFGYGVFPKVAITFLITFFPVLMNTMVGLSITEPDMINLMNTFHATKMQILTKIRLPRSLPYIISGLKIAGPLAVLGAIVSEFIIGDAGLGYMVQVAEHMVDMPMLFAVITYMAVMGAVLFILPFLIEKKLAPWYAGK